MSICAKSISVVQQQIFLLVFLAINHDGEKHLTAAISMLITIDLHKIPAVGIFLKKIWRQLLFSYI